MDLICATHNEHKMEEIRAIFNMPFIQLKSLKELNFHEDIEETGSTMEANALIKARYIAAKNTTNVMAEDSGLEVIALNMAPGVYTARYAGTAKDDQANMKKLLTNLLDVEDRSARFRSVFALILNGKEYVFEGWVNGQIAQEQKGSGGFGYDPIFIPHGYNETFAELQSEVKNEMSHRYRALMKMFAFLNKNG